MLEPGTTATATRAAADGDGADAPVLRLLDRVKDLVNRAGTKVYSAEVERVLGEHPAVAECACVAAPDPRSGETVAVFVVLADGAPEPAGRRAAGLGAGAAGDGRGAEPRAVGRGAAAGRDRQDGQASACAPRSTVGRTADTRDTGGVTTTPDGSPGTTGDTHGTDGHDRRGPRRAAPRRPRRAAPTDAPEAQPP